MAEDFVAARECRSCSHYFTNNMGASHCRRYPPTTMLLPMQTAIARQQGLELKGVYAPVGPKDFCGEYSRNLSYVPQAQGGRQ